MSALWIVTIASLVATYLNIRKLPVCFAIWTVTNTIWAIADWCAGIHAQAALHVAYIALALHGLRCWTRGDAHGEASTA